MPTIVGRTRREIRAAVLYNLGAIYEGTASAAGTTGTIVDNNLSIGATDDYRGRYNWFTSGTNNANLVRRITASAIPAGVTTLTFLPTITDATASGDTYQLIGKDGLYVHPAIINGFINQAIIEVTGLAYDPEESLALHGDARQRRFDIPSEFAMLNGVYLRVSVESETIHDAATAWDEAAAPTNVTRAVDTKDYKRGSGSNKFTIAGAFTTGLVSSKAISSLDISGYDYVEFWIKSTIATAAGDFTVLLDNTALSVSALETLSIPALVADTWTFVRVALSTPELDTAIISVGLNAANNIAANTIWINDVKAVLDSTAYWAEMRRNNWWIDEEARDLVCASAPGYYLMKIVGGDKPALLSADADVCEVDDQYVIARATELTAASATSDTIRALVPYWKQAADIAKRSLPFLVGVRTVG